MASMTYADDDLVSVPAVILEELTAAFDEVVAGLPLRMPDDRDHQSLYYQKFSGDLLNAFTTTVVGFSMGRTRETTEALASIARTCVEDGIALWVPAHVLSVRGDVATLAAASEFFVEELWKDDWEAAPLCALVLTDTGAVPREYPQMDAHVEKLMHRFGYSNFDRYKHTNVNTIRGLPGGDVERLKLVNKLLWKTVYVSFAHYRVADSKRILAGLEHMLDPLVLSTAAVVASSWRDAHDDSAAAMGEFFQVVGAGRDRFLSDPLLEESQIQTGLVLFDAYLASLRHMCV